MLKCESPHVEAYIIAKYARQIFPQLTEEAIRLSLADYFGFTPDEKDVQMFLVKFQPKSAKVSIVHALKSLGLSQMEIANLTGMSQAMVSRYANKEPKIVYKPSYFLNYAANEYVFNGNSKYSSYCTKYPNNQNPLPAPKFLQ